MSAKYVRMGSPVAQWHLQKRADERKKTAKFCQNCGKPLGEERVEVGLYIACSADCPKRDG